jgi:hypothetical protein
VTDATDVVTDIGRDVELEKSVHKQQTGHDIEIDVGENFQRRSSRMKFPPNSCFVPGFTEKRVGFAKNQS